MKNHEFEKVILFMSAIKKYIPDKRGEEELCDCPICHGTVTIRRDKHNGHIRAKCKVCKTEVMM